MNESKKPIEEFMQNYLLLPYLSAVFSMLSKFHTFFINQMKDCLLEFLILIGSPVYMAVRTRMLGVTQAPLFQETSRLRRRTGLAVGLLTGLFVFAAVRHSQNAETDFLSLAGFAVSFLVSFLLAQSAYRKMEEKSAEKPGLPV